MLSKPDFKFGDAVVPKSGGVPPKYVNIEPYQIETMVGWFRKVPVKTWVMSISSYGIYDTQAPNVTFNEVDCDDYLVIKVGRQEERQIKTPKRKG